MEKTQAQSFKINLGIPSTPEVMEYMKLLGISVHDLIYSPRIPLKLYVFGVTIKTDFIRYIFKIYIMMTIDFSELNVFHYIAIIITFNELHYLLFEISNL